MEMPRLPPIEYSNKVARACRLNNSKVCKQPTAIVGGNREALSTILSRDVDCEEVTYKTWESDSGSDFVAVLLLANFGRTNFNALSSPVLDPRVNEMGLDIDEHPIDGTIIQGLFVKESKK